MAKSNEDKSKKLHTSTASSSLTSPTATASKAIPNMSREELFYNSLIHAFQLLQTGVDTPDDRIISKAIRKLRVLRNNNNPTILKVFCKLLLFDNTNKISPSEDSKSDDKKKDMSDLSLQFPLNAKKDDKHLLSILNTLSGSNALSHVCVREIDINHIGDGVREGLPCETALFWETIEKTLEIMQEDFDKRKQHQPDNQMDVDVEEKNVKKNTTETSSEAANSSSTKTGEEKEKKKDYTDAGSITLKAIEFRGCLPEVEMFICVLLSVYLADRHLYEKGCIFTKCVISRLRLYNRRTLDLIASKCWFYFFRLHELNKSHQSIRKELYDGLSKAVLRHDPMTHATLLNSLLRSYILDNNHDLALKLVSKTTFPEALRSNAQHARHLYYIGSLQAIRLEYSVAFAKLQLAMRKAPQQSKIARGFRLAALKKSIVVELLMGDIPERSIFNRRDTHNQLQPYKAIVLAVRGGDLSAFSRDMQTYKNSFIRDGTWCLIQRLHHNVIRTGLRIISISYSKISLKDIATKLGLKSSEHAESIVSKAIADGVIDAQIDHKEGYVESKSNVDIYSSYEPQKIFHKRISFCLQLHNDALKAMQYKDTTAIIDVDEEAEARRKALQEEMARAEEDEIDDMDML